MKAIAIIQDEHRAITAVIEGLRHLVAGFAAYAKQQWDEAIRLFEEALPETVRIGGSRAQRDLVEHTLLAAYLTAGRPEDARRLVAKRTDRRATVPIAGFPAG